MYEFKDQKQVDKYTFIAMAGNLLKETRAGSDIDHIFLSDDETAEIVYKDKRRMHRRINIAGGSYIQILKDLMKVIE